MRYCLACRRFSADGPLCTQCGRSFGGRLCNHKKKRHLNPPDARVCGQCGTTNLTDAASFLPLGCSGRLVLWAALFGALWWGLDHVLLWSQLGFTGLTGYRSPLVWLIEKSAGAVFFLFIFYFLSMFMPGGAGEQFRGLIARLCLRAWDFALKMIGGLLKGTGKTLLRLLQGEKSKGEKKKY